MTDDPAALPEVVTTPDGESLEAAWTRPVQTRAVAVLTHPHPSHGGDMHNVVPATLARALPERGIATVRVNFRGVGRSSGRHGGGGAEIQDAVGGVDAASTAFPGIPVIGVGYSFGADVMLATGDGRLAAVVAVAPPLAILPIEQLAATRGAFPTTILSPAHDQFRPMDDARTATAHWPDTSVTEIPGADHFLAGATAFVVDAVVRVVDEVLSTA